MDPQNLPVTIDAVVTLIRDDRMRGFKIDVSTDQMIEADDAAEKQSRIELTTAIGQMVQQAAPLIMSPMGAALVPMVKATIMFAFKSFRSGRELEEEVEKSFTALEQQLSQAQPQQEDPVAKAKAEAELTKAQVEQQRVQMEAQIAALEAQLKQEKHNFDMQRLAKDSERADAETMLKAKELELKDRSQRDDIDHRRAESNLRLRQNDDGTSETVSAMDYRDDDIRAMMAQMADSMNAMGKGLSQLAQAHAAPKRFVRDENGRPIGSETVLPNVPPTT